MVAQDEVLRPDNFAESCLVQLNMILILLQSSGIYRTRYTFN